MAVDIQNIVSLDFNIKKTAISVGSYDKVVYLTNSESNYNAAAVLYGDICGNSDLSSNLVKCIYTKDEVEDEATAAFNALYNLKLSSVGTEDDFIFVCVDKSILDENSVQALASKDFLDKVNTLKAPNKIIICYSMTIDEVYNSTQDDYTLTFKVLQSYENVAVKLIPSATNSNRASDDVAVAIGAYFSNINLNFTGSIQDYSYTVEPDYLKVNIIQANYDNLIKVANFTDQIGNSVVNFGGNLTNENSISTMFGLICCENDVIHAVLNAMIQKQYLSDEGLNNIVSVINQALDRYTINGFLMQKANYTGETIYTTYTTVKRLLIKTGQPLDKGYFVATIPMSLLKAEDRKEHRYTPITVFMQTQLGARTITIAGDIVE